jgi:hypothetical protein
MALRARLTAAYLLVSAAALVLLETLSPSFPITALTHAHVDAARGVFSAPAAVLSAPSPGYAVFLALLLPVGETGLFAPLVVSVQLGLVLLTAWFCAGLTQRLVPDEPDAADAAFALALFLPTLPLAACRIAPDALLAACIAGGAFLLSTGLPTRRAGAIAGGIVLFAYGGTLRGEAVWLAPLALGVAASAMRGEGWRTWRVLGGAAVLTVLALTYLPAHALAPAPAGTEFLASAPLFAQSALAHASELVGVRDGADGVLLLLLRAPLAESLNTLIGTAPGLVVGLLCGGVLLVLFWGFTLRGVPCAVSRQPTLAWGLIACAFVLVTAFFGALVTGQHRAALIPLCSPFAAAGLHHMWRQLPLDADSALPRHPQGLNS